MNEESWNHDSYNTFGMIATDRCCLFQQLYVPLSLCISNSATCPSSDGSMHEAEVTAMAAKAMLENSELVLLGVKATLFTSLFQITYSKQRHVSKLCRLDIRTGSVKIDQSFVFPAIRPIMTRAMEISIYATRNKKSVFC